MKKRNKANPPLIAKAAEKPHAAPIMPKPKRKTNNGINLDNAIETSVNI